MRVLDFTNKKVAILGAGQEGFSSIDFFVKKKALTFLLDQRDSKEFDPALLIKIKQKNVFTIFGKGAFDKLNDFDYIIRSPGVSLQSKDLKNIDKTKVIITSQTKIFFDLCPCEIIGVTGTKGKSTTATLIYQLLKKKGLDVYLGGNIGLACLDLLPFLNAKSLVVLELSSFQLEDLRKSPHMAVLVKIFPEHLNYHPDIKHYLGAKSNILRFQGKHDLAVVDIDSWFNQQLLSEFIHSGGFYQVSVGHAVKQGCFIEGNKIVLSILKDNNKLVKEEIVDIDKISLLGKHNLGNVCCAIMACWLYGVDKDVILKVLSDFSGLPGRLEKIAVIKGVKYYNDSSSTTPESTIAAIQAFSSPEILIIGGDSKRSDFTNLGEVILKTPNIKAIIGIGKEWPRIKNSLKGKLTLNLIEGCKNMRDIISMAAKQAINGDIVLLSPGCASFDMFKNAKDRGNQFKKEVLGLKVLR